MKRSITAYIILLSIICVSGAYALTSDMTLADKSPSIYERRILSGPQFNIGLDICSFNYGQTVKGESSYLAMPLTYGITTNMSFPVAEELFIRPGVTFYFGGSYDSASDDTIKYSYSLARFDMEKTSGDMFYGLGANYPAWSASPASGALFDGMPGGQIFIGKFIGGWNYEFGWMAVNGMVNIPGSSFEQFTNGFYFKIGYE